MSRKPRAVNAAAQGFTLVNMTGMPAFGPLEVPDKDIWSIVAFIKKLPTVTEANYKAWTAPTVVTPVR